MVKKLNHKKLHPYLTQYLKKVTPKDHHLLSVESFADRNKIIAFCQLTQKIDKDIQKGIFKDPLCDKQMALYFYNSDSTRTYYSFRSAAADMGIRSLHDMPIKVKKDADGKVVEFLSTTSAGKGETEEDTVRIMSGNCDLMVIRHEKSYRVAELSSHVKPGVAVINAGDGSNEHPTQALLDIYTLYQKLGKLDNLKIALAGDLKYGRTVHSLIKLLSQFKNVTVYLVSHPDLVIPEEYESYAQKHQVKIIKTDNLKKIAKDIQALYMTRPQKERFKESPDFYQKVKDLVIVDDELIALNSNLLIMHPLPRNEEIPSKFDSFSGSIYFDQADNGRVSRRTILLLAATVGF